MAAIAKPAKSAPIRADFIIWDHSSVALKTTDHLPDGPS